MNYNTYTSKSPKVSEVGFGAWQLGNGELWHTMSDEEAIALVHEALDYGINYFDTAPGYGNGNSERLLGKAFENRSRYRLVINTKFGHTADGREDFSAAAIRGAIEDSCRRLKTDYLDSILLHNPPAHILTGQSEEHYEVFEALKKEGKILAYGASIDSAEDMIQFMTSTKGEIIEALFNINFQDARNAFDMALEKGVAIVAKVPLDSGWLSGKYDEHSTFTGIRSRWTPEDIKNRGQVIEMLRALPVPPQTLSQLALSYCTAYEAVRTVIPGCSNSKQLLSNVESTKYPLSQELIGILEDLYDTKIKGMKLPW
jgi:aryl-alcohol dehydrogenase-like predicted oxidoreductase